MSKMNKFISLEDCIDGNLYSIYSRNLSYGIFIKEVNGFTGIRQKFSLRYLFIEYHYDTGAPFGTVEPLKDLGPTKFGVLPKELDFIGQGASESITQLYQEVFKFLDNLLE